MNYKPAQILLEFLQKRGLRVEGSVLKMVTEAFNHEQQADEGVEPCSKEFASSLESQAVLVGSNDLKGVSRFLKNQHSGRVEGR
jgi:hypothetical protein